MCELTKLYIANHKDQQLHSFIFSCYAYSCIMLCYLHRIPNSTSWESLFPFKDFVVKSIIIGTRVDPVWHMSKFAPTQLFVLIFFANFASD